MAVEVVNDYPMYIDGAAVTGAAAAWTEVRSPATGELVGRVPAGTYEYTGEHTSFVRREPLGVVGQVTPWNYPMWMAIWKIGPALAAGNSVVLKPASATPLTTVRLAELALEAGVPPGVLNVVTGRGDVVGAALAAHPDVDRISLTGDVETGKAIQALAARNLKRVHLELGGKAPFIVCADADLEAAARGATAGALINGGQDCTAATRAYVARFPDGAFYRPTIVTDVAQDSEIVRDEVFGLVLAVLPFETVDEAIEKANDTRYGLAASIWTRDVFVAMEAARSLDFGHVQVNDHLMVTSEMPHGGFKQSGSGKEMSSYSFEEYTRV